jgi:hypothetical protein
MFTPIVVILPKMYYWLADKAATCLSRLKLSGNVRPQEEKACGRGKSAPWRAQQFSVPPKTFVQPP